MQQGALEEDASLQVEYHLHAPWLVPAEPHRPVLLGQAQQPGQGLSLGTCTCSLVGQVCPEGGL